MNTLTRAAAESVQGGVLMGVMTVLFVIFFVAWTAWAFSPAQKDRLDEAARIPFQDGGME